MTNAKPADLDVSLPGQKGAGLMSWVWVVPILALIIAGVYRQQPWLGRAAFAWALCYLMFGILQRDRAIAAGEALAAERGHTPLRLEAKPGFANLILWKVVYETQDRFFVDGVRVGLENKFFPGDSAEKLNNCFSMYAHPGQHV